MASEKRSADVTEPTPNVDSPVKKKVKADDDDIVLGEGPEADTNGHAEPIVEDTVVDAPAAEPEAEVPAQVIVQTEAGGAPEAEAEAEPEPMVVEEKEAEPAPTNGTETKTDDAAASWTPPPFGSVCWIQIPAVDVARGKKFYEDAFDFSFKPNPEGYKEEDIAMFTLNQMGGMLTGGICKAVENSTPGGGTVLYFMVEDVDKALAKIEGLGGKTREAKKPEGKHGLMGLFEDTEGNVHGVYQLATASEEAKE
ncbi:hypothetical protein TWF696_003632 [Orbilia brochopaga]|uniref:VOC domain-containing protein n=1 Tax=Orbilia brochopaga TaxID=3140254 RepID=A0AAV9TWD4_9PEZI